MHFNNNWINSLTSCLLVAGAKSTNELMALSAQGRILILQDYLKNGAQDIALRMFYLGNYLLLKGDPGTKEMTYLCYFHATTLEWYPEWEIDLGMPTHMAGRTVDDLARPGVKGIYQRDFANGQVLVNPTGVSSSDMFDPDQSDLMRLILL